MSLEDRACCLLANYPNGLLAATVAVRLGVTLGAVCHLRSKRIDRIKSRDNGSKWVLAEQQRDFCTPQHFKGHK